MPASFFRPRKEETRTLVTDAAIGSLPFAPGVEARISDRVRELGLSLCHIGWRPGRRRGVLTLTIDSPSGVTLDDCEKASRATEELLDELDAVAVAYVLEVESPGIDRPLWSVADCERFRGSRVRVELRGPVEGTSRLKGILEGVEGDLLTVLEEDKKRRYTVRFGDVKRARLVPGAEPGRGGASSSDRMERPRR